MCCFHFVFHSLIPKSRNARMHGLYYPETVLGQKLTRPSTKLTSQINTTTYSARLMIFITIETILGLSEYFTRSNLQESEFPFMHNFCKSMISPVF